MKSLLRLTGIGLRSAHHVEFLEKRPGVAWVEVHAENFFGEGGRALHELEQVRKDYPVSLHGVGLSLGSTDDLNWQHLKNLKELYKRIDPCLVSDHVSWSSIHGQYLHDLLPLPYTEEALLHLVERIKQVQDFLERQILIENISSYLTFPASTIPECEFIREVATQSNCGILLDINNVYVSSTNLNFNAESYISAIPANLVQEIHLAGFSTTTMNEKEVLIDSHDHAIVPAVWDLYRHAIKHVGAKPVIVEWDNQLPALDALYLEAFRAEQILRETYAAIKLTG